MKEKVYLCSSAMEALKSSLKGSALIHQYRFNGAFFHKNFQLSLFNFGVKVFYSLWFSTEKHSKIVHDYFTPTLKIL
jgi:hypothetical protein